MKCENCGHLDKHNSGLCEYCGSECEESETMSGIVTCNGCKKNMHENHICNTFVDFSGLVNLCYSCNCSKKDNTRLVQCRCGWKVSHEFLSEEIKQNEGKYYCEGCQKTFENLTDRGWEKKV